jgi:hypothetical protein
MLLQSLMTRLSGSTDWPNGRDEADAITASVHGLLSACSFRVRSGA